MIEAIGEGRTEEPQGAGMLFFNGADGDAQTISDFLMRKEFNLSEEKYTSAARGELRDGSLEMTPFLARHDLLYNARLRRRCRINRSLLSIEWPNLAAPNSIKGEIAGGGIEKCLGVVRRDLALLGIDAEVRIVGHILSFVGISEEAREITSQRCERCAVKRREIRFYRLIVSHSDRRWHKRRSAHVQRRF